MGGSNRRADMTTAAAMPITKVHVYTYTHLILHRTLRIPLHHAVLYIQKRIASRAGACGCSCRACESMFMQSNNPRAAVDWSDPCSIHVGIWEQNMADITRILLRNRTFFFFFFFFF
jgi:hypothetical protein